jgi:hypothetical protein
MRLDFDLVLSHLRSDTETVAYSIFVAHTTVMLIYQKKKRVEWHTFIVEVKPGISAYERLNSVWVIFLGGRNRSVNGRCYSTHYTRVRLRPSLTYFVHIVMQYRKVGHFKVSYKVDPTFSGCLPKGGGNFIEFGLWDMTIPRARE